MVRHMIFSRLQLLSIAEQMKLFPDIAAIDYQYTEDWNDEVEE